MHAHCFFRLSLIFLFWLSATAMAFGHCSSHALRANDTPADDGKTIKILVAYQSKYGSTKQYAAWIQKDTKCDLIRIQNGDAPRLAEYDIIVVGGYIRAGEIVVAPFIRENWAILQGKKVVLFTTSGTPPGHPKIHSIYNKSFSEEIREKIRYFSLPGRISSRELTFWDKRLITIGRMLETDASLKKDMGKDFDGVKRDKLLPLIEYINDIKMLLTKK